MSSNKDDLSGWGNLSVSGCNTQLNSRPCNRGNDWKMTGDGLISRPLFFCEFKRSREKGETAFQPSPLWIWFNSWLFWPPDSPRGLCQIIWQLCLRGLWSALRIASCTGHMWFSSLTFYCRQRGSVIKGAGKLFWQTCQTTFGESIFFRTFRSFILNVRDCELYFTSCRCCKNKHPHK